VSLSVPLRSVGGMSERRFGRTPGGLCSLGLHLVWCPTYRLRVRGGRIARPLGELLEQIAAERGWQIVVKEVMPDHLHVFARVFKGRTARALRQQFAHLRRLAERWCGRRRTSSPRSATCGSRRVRGFIEHQWDAVMAS
jgi:putative transposase